MTVSNQNIPNDFSVPLMRFMPSKTPGPKAALALWLMLFCLFAEPAPAAVYNLHLVTDNAPDYTDLPSFVASATDAWKTPQEKCIAIWRWGRRSRRQTSCATEDGRLIWDPILHYNSYGAMNCGVISSLNIAAWLQLGYRARYVQLGDHTVSEVSWDDGQTWHLFDSSMSVFCYNHNGQVASCQEILESHACELSGGQAEPGHYYLYHSAPQCASHPGPTGWRCAGDQPVGYNRTLAEGASSYTSGFSIDRYCQYARSGHRYVLNLRAGESYTRYWHPLDDARAGGDVAANDPDYFRPMANGSDPDDQHGLNNLRGNGVWQFEPELSGASRARLFYDFSGLADPAAPGPHLHPIQSGRAYAVFEISAANVITSMQIEARGLAATEADHLRLSVSRDACLHWTQVWESTRPGPQAIQVHLREPVAGGVQCWIKVEMEAAETARNAGLDKLHVTTTTQLDRRTLPALTLGSNEVLLRADAQVPTVELWPALHAGHDKETAFAEDHVFSADQPDGMYKATLGAGVNNQPCSVTWRVPVPDEIADVTFDTVSTVRNSHSYVSLQYSWNGRDFTEFHRNASDGFPFDQQFSRTFTCAEIPRTARDAYFRAVFFCTGGAATYNMPGLQDVLIQVHHRAPDLTFQPLEVTYNWTEHRETGDITRSHTELVRSFPHRYEVNVAGRRDPTMNWVRIRPQSSRGETDGSRSGYSDGVDVGPGFEFPKVAYRWAQSVSLGKPYTASRPSSTASGNPDRDGRELTNGRVIAPTDEMGSKAVQEATAFWDAGAPVTFVLDLEQARPIAGLRVTTHQPNARFCHPKIVQVAVSGDGEHWQPAGVIHHDDLWKPPGDYEPWEHDDDPSYAELPAGGRLAYSFPLAFPQPISGRYVKLVCAPLDGKGMGLSEIQAFEKVDVVPWPKEIALVEKR